MLSFCILHLEDSTVVPSSHILLFCAISAQKGVKVRCEAVGLIECKALGEPSAIKKKSSCHGACMHDNRNVKKSSHAHAVIINRDGI